MIFGAKTDFGPDVLGLSDKEVKVARDALVFMVNGLNSGWRLPLGYFFNAGLSSKGRVSVLLPINNMFSF